MTQSKKAASHYLSYALTHTSCTCRSRDRTRSVPCGNEVFVGNCRFKKNKKQKKRITIKRKLLVGLHEHKT